MQEKIEQHIQRIQNKGFVISDIEKATGYLRQVGIYRLSRYASVFKSEIENGEKIDFQRVVDCYVFDKQLRTHCMSLLEIIEVSLKNLLVLHIGNTYSNSDLYVPKFVLKRMGFIYQKSFSIIEREKHFQDFIEKGDIIPAQVFFNDLSFGEAVRFLNDLKPKHKNSIVKEFEIPLSVLENWLNGMVHLRNLCSHAENIFNKKMKHTLVGNFFDESFGTENDDRFISYLVVLQIFQKLLIPNYQWKEGIVDLMTKYDIETRNFADIKIAPLFELSPIKFGSSAWEAFVHIIYTKYIKK